MAKKKPVRPAARVVKKSRAKQPAVSSAAEIDVEQAEAVLSAEATTGRHSLRRVLRLGRRPKTERPPRPAHRLPSAFRLLWQAVALPLRHWEIFGGVMVVYAGLSILIIGGVAGSAELSSFKEQLGSAGSSSLYGRLSSGVALFGYLVATGANSAVNGFANAYQTILLLVVSLALIWGLRQTYAGHTVRVRDTFYEGMRPLVPYILVLLTVFLQLVPGVLGGFLYYTLIGGKILAGLLPAVVMGLVFFLSVVLSFYLLCSSLFALYIVTLPGMTPWRALRSARDIVRYRRAKVLLRLLCLLLASLLALIVVLVPIAAVASQAAPFALFVLTVTGILLAHSYMYALYRELIVE